jgi:ketosteroid isomerase-like protein
MGEQENRDAAGALWTALAAGDWAAAADLLHPDFVQEWPQSRERIVGADNAIAIDKNFPGGLPAMTVRRTVAGGDLVTVEIDLAYADGSHYQGISVLEFRDEKIVKETDYFAQPFNPPQWRSQWVERM